MIESKDDSMERVNVEEMFRAIAAKSIVLESRKDVELPKKSNVRYSTKKKIDDFPLDMLYSQKKFNFRNIREFHAVGNSLVSLLDLEPQYVKFQDLAECMRPVLVPGLEHLQGVVGSIEGENEYRKLNNEEDKGSGKGKQTEINNDDEMKTCEDALVWVHFSMFLEGAKIPFDSTMNRNRGNPEIVVASEKTTLPGLALACRWLQAGQRARLILPPSCLFGELGCPPRVPPHASALLLIHVIKVLNNIKFPNLDDESKVDFNIVSEIVNKTNVVAKDFFGRKKYDTAKAYYRKCIELLMGCKKNHENTAAINKLTVKTMLNLAVCYDKLFLPIDSLHILDQASTLEKYTNNPKAMFLRGTAHLKLSEYDDAELYLKRALELEPHNEDIARQLIRLERILSSSKNDEVKMCQKVFGKNQDIQKKCSFYHQFSTEEGEAIVTDFKNMLKARRNSDFIFSKELLEEECKYLKEIVEECGGKLFVNYDSKYKTITSTMIRCGVKA